LKKLKNEKELVKKAIVEGVKYAEGRVASGVRVNLLIDTSDATLWLTAVVS
jgi:hypothetical protein